MKLVNIVVEGDTDLPVVRKLLAGAGLVPGKEIVSRGKQNLDPQLPGYSAAAEHAAWFVLRDLDHDAPCPAELIDRIAPRRGRYLCLRIAVRAIEAWLLADVEQLARYLRVPRAKLPADPDSLPDPKQQLVNLARASPKPRVVKDMVPRRGATRRVGAGYELRIIEFASTLWRAEIARQRSPSLDRCMIALDRLAVALAEP